MVLAKILSTALVGLDAHLIEVEVDISGGLPQFSVVGLPDGPQCGKAEIVFAPH